LYASFAGPIADGLTSSTRLMVITTTSAALLALRSVLADRRPEALLLALIAGAVLGRVAKARRRVRRALVSCRVM
jgi:SulP family sulfate permease